MDATEKQKALNRHKLMATLLLLLMAIIFIACLVLQRSYNYNWLGYVQAFAEAAMVGALADWFAVTALFHHPLGIPIPHTNLIENSKKKIGDNLGNFVVDNFLQPKSIRPYISKLYVTPLAADWLVMTKNRQLLISEIVILLKDILHKLDDNAVAETIAVKGADILRNLPAHTMLGSVLEYIVQHREHDQLVTLLAGKIKEVIRENETVVREKVQQESFFFIPGFIDRKLAGKITQGLVQYFDEVENDPMHHVRIELDAELTRFSLQLTNDPAWEKKLNVVIEKFVTKENLMNFAIQTWKNIKDNLLDELSKENSRLQRYFKKSLEEFALKLKTDVAFTGKIDGWIRHTAYRLILKNRNEAGTLISNTIGNWQGKELSEKLEMEVGKDLQFIRINGTIVGGLVGLLLHFIAAFL